MSTPAPPPGPYGTGSPYGTGGPYGTGNPYSTGGPYGTGGPYVSHAPDDSGAFASQAGAAEASVAPAAAGPMRGEAAESGIRAVLDRTFEAILPHVSRSDNAPLLNPVRDPAAGFSPVARLMRYSDVTTVVSAGRRGSLLGVIERAWLSFGYVIDEVNGDFSMPSIDVRTPDGYSLQLSVGAPGNVYFLVSSPLISRPADPLAYSTPLVPTQLPHQEHPFWSH